MAFEYLLVQALHILRGEGRFQRYYLVQYATQGPHVALNVVGLIPPHLRTRIVGSTGLSVVEASLVGDLGNVHVSQLCCEVLIQKDICAL
jgi:hypothetical protein